MLGFGYFIHIGKCSKQVNMAKNELSSASPPCMYERMSNTYLYIGIGIDAANRDFHATSG